jgi:hypothetical protein
MDMLGHHDESDYNKLMLSPSVLQNLQQEIAASSSIEKGPSVVTTPSQEVQMLDAVVSLETSRHRGE